MVLFEWILDIGLAQAIVLVGDFLLIAAVIYFVLRFMRFTIGLPLLLSMSVLVLAYGLVSALGFKATKGIFENSTQWLAFTIVVLFQDDIRRLILKANPNDLLNRFFGTSTDIKANEQLIRVVVDSAQVLIGQDLGALIVIDRNNDLGDYTANAVSLDAALSKELLYSIFIPTHGNPLHDGAAVITSSRIVAAGCFLPLSTNSEIDLALGTRHRAGIGLSEVSAALVIVVSEETGGITICEEGRYLRFPKGQIDAFRGELQRRLASKSRGSTGRIASAQLGV